MIGLYKRCGVQGIVSPKNNFIAIALANAVLPNISSSVMYCLYIPSIRYLAPCLCFAHNAINKKCATFSFRHSGNRVAIIRNPEELEFLRQLINNINWCKNSTKRGVNFLPYLVTFIATGRYNLFGIFKLVR